VAVPKFATPKRYIYPPKRSTKTTKKICNLCALLGSTNKRWEMGRQESKLDARTRRGIQAAIREMVDAHGHQSVSLRSGIPVSSIENHLSGKTPPKLATLDAYAGVWRAGAQAEDLLAYIRGKSPSGVNIPEGLLWEHQLKDRPAMERLRLATLLIQSLKADLRVDSGEDRREAVSVVEE
jgi:hypothetical protein